MEMEILLPNVTPADIRTSRLHQMFPRLTEVGHRADQALWNRATLRARRAAVRRRRARSRHVRRSRGSGDQPAGRHGARGTDHAPGPRPVPRRGRTLSGRPALVDCYAEEDIETLLVPPEQLRALIIAEADLGERIVRALILRRVGLIQAGASGPVLIGEPIRARCCGCKLPEAKRLSPPRRRSPATERGSGAMLAQYGAAPAPCSWSAPTARCCSIRPRRRSVAASACSDTASTTRSFDVAVVGAGPGGPRHRRLRGVGRACASSCSTAGRSAGRPARARASRTTWAFRPGSRARRWPVARSCRRRSSARRC